MVLPTVEHSDYYQILGVPRDADAEAIKNAFHLLARRYHPDRCGEPGAEARFKEITEAYTVLSDPARRAEYDAGLWEPSSDIGWRIHSGPQGIVGCSRSDSTSTKTLSSTPSSAVGTWVILP